jgi:hypothetical protein
MSFFGKAEEPRNGALPIERHITQLSTELYGQRCTGCGRSPQSTEGGAWHFGAAPSGAN